MNYMQADVHVEGITVSRYVIDNVICIRHTITKRVEATRDRDLLLDFLLLVPR